MVGGKLDSVQGGWRFLTTYLVVFTTVGGFTCTASVHASNPVSHVNAAGFPGDALFCLPSEPNLTATGVFTVSCNGTDSDTVVDGDDIRIVLTRGTVGFFVTLQRDPKKTVTIHTPFGSVRADNTVFTVQADDKDTRFEVFRGNLEVFPEGRADIAFSLSQGSGVSLRKVTTFKLSAPSNSVLIDTLLEMQVGLQPNSVLENADVNDNNVDADAGAAPISESVDNFILKAQSCMLARNWYCAAYNYEKVLTAYSNGPEASPVLISLGKIELRHLNLPKTALAHYQLYLELAPNGPLAEEALLGTAGVYRKLGITAEERTALQTFAQKFPKSTLLKEVLYRLNRLEAAPRSENQ